MVALAEFSDAAYVRQLWDVHLKAVWESAAAAEAGEGASEESAAAAALEADCVEAEQLGEQFFPDEIRCALPLGRWLAAELCHEVFTLESMPCVSGFAEFEKKRQTGHPRGGGYFSRGGN